MRYATVCSGAEAFGKEWHRMGYSPVFHAEIEKHACVVLKHHYPEVPNRGDFTTISPDDYAPGFVQLLAGGTPCQSFSVAGLRGGLADARGNLTLGFCKLAAILQPRWILWENVPGVLSSNGGRDFGAFLGGLAHIGYGFAYRVLDAQYFGVAQRRRRVFVVGHLGDWRRAAAVLFERESLQGHPAPRREKREDVAPTVRAGAANGSAGKGARSGDSKDELITLARCQTAREGQRQDYETETLIAHTLRAQGQLAHRADVDTLIAFDTTQITSPQNGSNPQAGDPCHPLSATAHAPALAFTNRAHHTGELTETLRAQSHGAIPMVSAPQIADTKSVGANQTTGFFGEAVANHGVRRLTPLECERLQGWDDHHTRYGTDEKGREHELSDSARYRIIGNGWAAPVANWIANRILKVDSL